MGAYPRSKKSFPSSELSRNGFDAQSKAELQQSHERGGGRTAKLKRALTQGMTFCPQFVHLQPLPIQIIIFPPHSNSPGAQGLPGGVTTVTNQRAMAAMGREMHRKGENTSKGKRK